MVKKVSKSAQLKSKLNKAIIDTIVVMGGSALRRDIITAIENSQVFDAWESEVLRSNKKRWVTALDIQSNELVKSGQIIKQNGVWKILDEFEFISGFVSSIKTEKLMSKKYQPPLPRKFSPEDMDDFIVEKRLSSKEEQFNDSSSDNKTLYDLLEPTWMQIIRGKVNPDPNDLDGKDAKILRSAFLTYERKKAIESIDTNKKFEEFGEKLAVIGHTESEVIKTKKDLSWWALIKLMIALVSGLVIGMMVPMQVATRGGSDHLLNFQFLTRSDSNVETEITILASESNKTPFLKAQEITLSALSAGLIVTTEKQSDAIRLTIKGFTKMNPDLIPINSVLGLSNQTQGNVSVLILE